MKLTPLLSLTTALLVFAATPAFAVKAAKAQRQIDPAKKAARQAARAAAAYDKNSDGTITGDESAELRKAFEADKTGPLKAFDRNTDGALDDNEISAVKIGKHPKRAGAGKGAAKKKKNAA